MVEQSGLAKLEKRIHERTMQLNYLRAEIEHRKAVIKARIDDNTGHNIEKRQLHDYASEKQMKTLLETIDQQQVLLQLTWCCHKLSTRTQGDIASLTLSVEEDTERLLELRERLSELLENGLHTATSLQNTPVFGKEHGALGEMRRLFTQIEDANHNIQQVQAEIQQLNQEQETCEQEVFICTGMYGVRT
jgi:regulator of replication initiation timing